MAHQTELQAFEDQKRYEEFNRRPFIRAIRQEFERILQQHSFLDKTVLEIGCAAASFEKECHGARFIVSSDLNLHLLKNNSGPKAVCDGEFASFKDRSFHIIILSGVLHHYSDQERGLRELKRLRAPGGTILMVEPRTKSLNSFYRLLRRIALKALTPKQLGAVIGCYSPDESLVDEERIAAAFRDGYRVCMSRKFCLRFPPLPLLRRFGADVAVSRWLDRFSLLNRFGTMLFATIQERPC